MRVGKVPWCAGEGLFTLFLLVQLLFLLVQLLILLLLQLLILLVELFIPPALWNFSSLLWNFSSFFLSNFLFFSLSIFKEPSSSLTLIFCSLSRVLIVKVVNHSHGGEQNNDIQITNPRFLFTFSHSHGREQNYDLQIQAWNIGSWIFQPVCQQEAKHWRRTGLQAGDWTILLFIDIR